MEVRNPKSTVAKWDWKSIEALVLSGKSPKEICAMPEFQGLNTRYLQNISAKNGWVKKRREIEAASLAGMDKKIVERKSEGVEAHHKFVFGQLERLRSAISEKQVKGSVKELREYLDMLQKYLDAAETSYGLKADQVKDESAVSLNAMVALHILPPSKAVEAQVIEVKEISTSVECENGTGDKGSEGMEEMAIAECENSISD